MTTLVTEETFFQDSELNQYVHSFQRLQAWLLDEDTLEESAAAEVLAFFKAGLRVKKKKNFKLYFEQFNQDELKQFANVLTSFVKEKDDTEEAHIKKELISFGMLAFTQQYIEQFSAYARQQASEQRIVEPPLAILTPYTEWLRGNVRLVVDELEVQHKAGSITEASVRLFVDAFRSFTGKSLAFRITHVTAKVVKGIPLEWTADGYKEMRHPFLTIPWEVSAPIYVKNIAYHVGDIVEASYKEARNENFQHLLILVDFGHATIVPRALVDVLGDVLTSTVAKEMLAKLSLPEEDEQLQAYVVGKLVQSSAAVREQVESELVQLTAQIQQVEERRQELQREEQSLNTESKQWQAIIERIDSYKEKEQPPKEELEELGERYVYEPDEFIQHLQSLFYYNDDQQLVYNEAVIRSFVYAIQANVLTILAGPSGTGKSSIVHAFARAVEHAEVRMVPVQSSWTDTQDLLGYFHPTDKAFVPTPFMEAMAEAALKENAHKIFLICLDEMNLAHVEYYFSEILSAREEKKQQIHLYPKRHWETAKLILQEGTADIERLQSAKELIELYPPLFTIPPNVRFIGTLNMDHTVKPLSPKVIDRSFIIEINHLKAVEKNQIVASLRKMKGQIELNYEEFAKDYMDEMFLEFYLDALQKVSNLFEDYPNAALNSRGYKHLTRMLMYCKSGDEMSAFRDYLVYGKILPRLEIKKADFVPQANVIQTELRKYPKSFEKLQKMTDVKHTITFW